ncbi:unnamed protein product [Ectocarpus sp. 6 AP-2014]
MVTLLHFTHPLWLEDRGGFEDGASPAAFVAFSRRMYREYGGKVSLWCTINEPEVCTANGYAIGMFPPGKLAALQKSGIVLGNLLKAHVYIALHEEAAAAGREVEVGIVKDLFQFHPYRWYNVLDHLLAWLCDKLFNQVIIEFLKTGRYRWWVPFCASVRFTDGRAPKANDFVGLNYYSHYYASLWNVIFEPDMEEKLRALPAETMTDMPHCVYPEGLYCALKAMSAIGHPIYVTENGIADADDTRRRWVLSNRHSYKTVRPDRKVGSATGKSSQQGHRPKDQIRRLYLKRYLYALSRAIKDGCDVRGYFYWSLYDNFEWCEGYGPRFGLYEVDFDTQRRTLRDSSKYYVEVVKKYSGKKASSGLAPDTAAVVGEGNVIGSRAAIYHKLKSSANVSEYVLQGGGGGAEPGESGERDMAGEPPAGYSIV